MRESLVDCIVTVGDVRRVVSSDCVPSRAIERSVSLRVVGGSDRRCFVEGRGFGSVVVRWERS